MQAFRVLVLQMNIGNVLLIGIAFGFYMAFYNLDLNENKMNVSEYLPLNPSMEVQIQNSYALAKAQNCNRRRCQRSDERVKVFGLSVKEN